MYALNSLAETTIAVTAWLALCGCLGCDAAPTLQQDGGYRITYQVRSAEPGDVQIAVASLQRRLAACGLKASDVLASGTDRIEITLPGIGPEKFAQVEKLIVTPGRLEFLILAQAGTHDALIATALAEEPSATDSDQATQLEEAAGVLSKWVRFDPENLDLPSGAIQRTRDGQSDVKVSEVLVILDEIRVDDRSLATVSATVDSSQQPAISGRLTPEGSISMRQLTTDNSPRDSVYQSLGVVLDGRLLLSPRIVEPIGEAFMLTGKFTKQEIDFLVAVLRTGRLAVDLNPVPVSVEQVAKEKE